MSTKNNQSTEQLIRKLLKQMERKGKNIPTFLWKLMDEFESEELDEKNDEMKVNHNNNKVSLLYDERVTYVCEVGHGFHSKQNKHLSINPCVVCGHKNNNASNKATANNKQMLKFFSEYNTHQIPFGPHQNQKGEIKQMIRNGWDKTWPLHIAAVSGDIKKINQFAQRKNINMDQKMTNWSDRTPITLAARFGQLDAVIELMKNGANFMPPPDRGNNTPYQTAVFNNHKSIIVFFKAYVKYLYNFDINNATNLECYKCYQFDLNFNKQRLNGTMANYVYCTGCTLENVEKVKKKQEINAIIERRIIKTLKQNPSISVDTLCQMKDVKSLRTILQEIIVSGQSAAYTLWLLDIDNFKAINTHLTHAIADSKLQALGQVLKKLEAVTEQQWENTYDGLWKVWAFRQGGDEFALVVWASNKKMHSLQKLYERLKSDVNEIKLGKRVHLKNGNTMEYVTVSIGVCGGQGIANVEEMMTRADEAAETIKKGGKNDIAIYWPSRDKIYKDFNDM